MGVTPGSRQHGRRSKSSERAGHQQPDLALMGHCYPHPIAFCHQDTFRLRRRNSSLENLNQIFALDETSDKPKENRVVKFHDEAPERGRSGKKSKSKVKSRSLVRTSTSILKDTSSSLVNINPDPNDGPDDIITTAKHEEDKHCENSKKKEKKKKRGKSDEKKKDVVSVPNINTINSSPVMTISDKLLHNSVNIGFPLNLSTEESGYESDLTRKTSSKVSY